MNIITTLMTKTKCVVCRKDTHWVTRGRGKGINSRGRGRSSPGSSVSGSSCGSSSSYSPIIQRGGMSLVKLKTSQKESTSSSSIHLEDIPEDNPLYAELRAYLSQKEKGDTFASIAKDDIDKSYEKNQSRRELAKIKCYKYGKFGHLAPNCKLEKLKILELDEEIHERIYSFLYTSGSEFDYDEDDYESGSEIDQPESSGNNQPAAIDACKCRGWTLIG
ncbi:hypothetical protein MTR67_012957 [Solanum verrucosum]|uniref:Zinc knuckle family protein n=1 Tax=Solanum verrucosum TaxID=315347 RepID=A0AAF0Q9N8_SOLVR|nr:hypothetical protein MTR67_012957 [Solanum verrucosum]